jgi:hypothetical protein
VSNCQASMSYLASEVKLFVDKLLKEQNDHLHIEKLSIGPYDLETQMQIFQQEDLRSVI